LPEIDYLSRDFDSFKHLLINAMRVRVPDWEPTSEADLDQVIIDLLAADADEQCDYQDRVLSEAYLGRARKRVSLARHARLMDYHIHQGNQASTWLAFNVTTVPPTTAVAIPAGYGVWTTDAWDDDDSVIFLTEQGGDCYEILNQIGLYTWDGALTALDAGATEADLALPAPLNSANHADADQLRDILRDPGVTRLAVEELLNPETGRVNGREILKRQLLELLEGNAAAESVFDPQGNGGAGAWFVRVYWRPEDRLRQRYCFITRCTGVPPNENVSGFTGNLLPATHGRPHRAEFHPAGTNLPADDNSQLIRVDHRYLEPTPWGVLATLPRGPLAYRYTPPGGDVRPVTTLEVSVDGFASPWMEQIDLISSQDDDEHFIVETDEMECSRIRFGNGRNGRALPQATRVVSLYQVGAGSDGNVGADTLTGFDSAAVAAVNSVRNPFDVVDGRTAQPAAEIIRRVPEHRRSRQLRAVTLADYEKRAESLDEVAHASARYAWTGSWRAVRVAIDPVGTTELTRSTINRIAGHLNAGRLIGDDLEVRQARYVALDIKVRLCAHQDYWIEDLETELEMEFSDGYTADGRPGFFHPDEWTFGQTLHASQIIGRALEVTGVERVLSVSMRRFNAGLGMSTSVITLLPHELPDNLVDAIEVESDEVILVANDPDHLERGRILFDISGGRR
jgi:hypothetical protein